MNIDAATNVYQRQDIKEASRAWKAMQNAAEEMSAIDLYRDVRVTIWVRGPWWDSKNREEWILDQWHEAKTISGQGVLHARIHDQGEFTNVVLTVRDEMTNYSYPAEIKLVMQDW